MPTLPMVVIVDGLDECDDRELIASFIEIVASAIPSQLRFFFTSRVEEHIRKKFLTSPALPQTFTLALEEFDADRDLRMFFRSRFSTIYEENNRLMRDIGLPWPSSSDLDELVHKSSQSFIFAFTLVVFVNDGSDLPDRKLQAALRSHDGLDPLYTQVLQAGPHSPHFRRTFETIMTAMYPLSITDVACLLRVEGRDVVHALQSVQSILVVPEDDNRPIQPFHTSLRDFVTTKARSKELYINPAICHLSICCDCLTALTAHNGGNFFEVNGLKYASRMWCNHLLSAIQADGGDNLLVSQHGASMIDKLTCFLTQSFDPWIDCLIIQRRFPSTMKMLDGIIAKWKESYNVGQDMQMLVINIKTYGEMDEKLFCEQCGLKRYDDDSYFFEKEMM